MISGIEMVTSRSVVLASADAALRQRLHESLTEMRWQVREAQGGAEAMAHLEEQCPEALLMDHWLPDLEAGEFAQQVSLMYPGMELLRVDGNAGPGAMRSPRRHELLHALREAQGRAETASGRGAGERSVAGISASGTSVSCTSILEILASSSHDDATVGMAVPLALPVSRGRETRVGNRSHAIPGMIGSSAPMLELARLIRLVAPRSATVLIEGETGSGKEVVARALHRLSARSGKPFVVLNCAAIPESLLEAELFGHTRGAFTGAVQSRTGRIEAADGGTLFLDEIGEMPLPLQAKILRFLECGELQRVGDNEVVRVDVRVVAATHQPLERRSAEGTFRLDLYHRLAVFPIEVPALRDRLDDIGELAEHLLAELGKGAPRKRLSEEALVHLQQHDWSGNVRELAHVLERATILAEDSPEIGAADIRMRRATSKPPHGIDRRALHA